MTISTDSPHSPAATPPPGAATAQSIDPHNALTRLLSLNYNACSAAVWNEPTLRPGQERVLCQIGNPTKSRHVFVVMRPGGGKTHITRVAGVVEKGITLVIIMLHTLSADQMDTFTSANQVYGTVTAHNVDKIHTKSKIQYMELIARAGSLRRDTTSTAFLIVSPQFMIHHPDFMEMLIKQAHNRVLGLVVIDEVHLFV
jgi:superfamily II DNA helicase RecQ